MLAGAKTAAASFPVGGLKLPKDALGRSMALLGAGDPTDGLWQAPGRGVDRDLQEAARVLGRRGRSGSGTAAAGGRASGTGTGERRVSPSEWHAEWHVDDGSRGPRVQGLPPPAVRGSWAPSSTRSRA